MPSWSALPTNLRQEIVERLDFRTRFRFRHVSKSNQELVDSTPLYIPRVVLDFKKKQVVKLSFYLDIMKWIDVHFVNMGEPKTSVKIIEFSNGHCNQHGVIRQVDSPSAPTLALTAFRNVAMHPDTLSGAIELIHPRYIDMELEKCEPRVIFGDRKLRTKIVCFPKAINGLILSRVVASEVEEIRAMTLDAADMKKEGGLLTHTRRLRVRVDEEQKEKLTCEEDYCFKQMYITPTDLERKICASLEDYQDYEEAVRVEIQDNDVLTSFKGEMGPKYQRMNSCGIIWWGPKFDVTVEDPTACSMRWACPIHADPFDHWYTTRNYIHSDDEKGYFQNFFTEHVFPVWNGEDIFVDQMIDLWSNAWKKKEERPKMNVQKPVTTNPTTTKWKFSLA